MKNSRSLKNHAIDRRRFLGALGSGIALSGAAGLAGVEQALGHDFGLSEKKFGRMFPRLEPFFERTTRSLNEALLEAGKLGGVLDARDRLPASASAADQAQTAIDLIVNPDLNAISARISGPIPAGSRRCRGATAESPVSSAWSTS